MRLISCENCGILLDTERIEKPDIYDGEDGEISQEAVYVYFKGFIPTIICPACERRIRYDNGDI